ncbi:hypothetical protein R9C00_19595 [Flammeovirgaceae bacterium SG7u.111]|nr:hypothetical protein [Flammeovirgaceae bacterium SG7u.132]WPO33906.1 hypothetical protein R9C00_19595 [Flammeovirgaceae bacterium SG7u.111]
MNKLLFYIISFLGILVFAGISHAYSQDYFTLTNRPDQPRGSFTINGDASIFYPVVFTGSNANNNNSPVSLQIYRNNVHENGSWTGTCDVRIMYTSSNWGHNNRHYQAYVTQLKGRGENELPLVSDILPTYKSDRIIIWLRGGGITYYWTSTDEIIVPSTENTWGNNNQVTTPQGEIFTTKSKIEDKFKPNSVLVHTGRISGASLTGGSASIGVDNLSIPEGYKLAVGGKAIMEEVKVELEENWPDYVFEENYALPTLSEVESYIQENNHLQDIPSAKEVEANGINLGEMDAKLLQKIEELMLYTIEQEKKIEKQEKEITELKKQEEEIKELKKLVHQLIEK